MPIISDHTSIGGTPKLSDYRRKNQQIPRQASLIEVILFRRHSRRLAYRGADYLFKKGPSGFFSFTPMSGTDLLRTMAIRRDKIEIEVLSFDAKIDTNENAFRVSHDAVLRLAQLIGQQIAREQFAREQKTERGQRQTKNADQS